MERDMKILILTFFILLGFLFWLVIDNQEYQQRQISAKVQTVCISGKSHGIIVRGPMKGIYKYIPEIPCKEE